ncbi:MAG TPA: TlpA disulfide reductase family protein [Holophaga sp.]|nr:TlpA disulfide reductase family protein [Holophaga sp.]
MRARVLLLALALGAPAAAVPPFALKALDGSTFRLGDHLGRSVIVLDFWATWCGPCLRALRSLQDLAEAHPGVLVLAVSIDDARSLARVQATVKGRGYTFRVLLDPDSSVLRLFNPDGAVPATLVIDRRGEIAYRRVGFIPGDERALEAKVRELAP